MSTRTVTLDPDDPIASLLTATGVLPSELARRRKVAQPTISDSIGARGRVSLEILLASSKACGVEPDEIRFHPAAKKRR